MPQQRSGFGGGGFFGRPLNMAPQTSPLGQPKTVFPAGPVAPTRPAVQPSAPGQVQGQPLPFKQVPAAPPPSASFQSKRVPMGNPGDCPICH